MEVGIRADRRVVAGIVHSLVVCAWSSVGVCNVFARCRVSGSVYSERRAAGLSSGEDAWSESHGGRRSYPRTVQRSCSKITVAGFSFLFSYVLSVALEILAICVRGGACLRISPLALRVKAESYRVGILVQLKCYHHHHHHHHQPFVLYEGALRVSRLVQLKCYHHHHHHHLCN